MLFTAYVRVYIYINVLLIKREVTISGYWSSSFVCLLFASTKKEFIIDIVHHAGLSGLSRTPD